MKWTIIIAVLSFSFFVNAKEQTEKRHFLHLKASNLTLRSELAKYIHIDQVVEDSVYSVVNEHDLKQIKKKFSQFIVETHPLQLKDSNGKEDEFQFPNGDEKFHTYEEVQTKMKELARTYPKLVTYFEIGTSVEGKAIPAIKMTLVDKKTSGNFTPAVLFVGTHHAREHLSTEIPTLMMSHLAKEAQSEGRIQNLLKNRELYFVPMLNPDGAMYDIKGKRYKSWRKNRATNAGSSSKGVDLNRNYGFGWGTGGSSRSPSSDVYMGPKAFSEPETQAVKAFVEGHPNIRILVSYHTFSELILYPWGGKHDDVGGKDQQVFETMARKMATWNNYKPMKSSGLYIASGDTCDWAYGEHGIFCFTFELSPKSIWSGGFYPGAKAIDKTFKVNVEPALYLIEHAADPYGVIAK